MLLNKTFLSFPSISISIFFKIGSVQSAIVQQSNTFANIKLDSQHPSPTVFQNNWMVLHKKGKEGNIVFNNTLNTFFLWLYGVTHMVKDHSDSERGNPLPHRLLFLISSKGSFICTIPQTG